MDRKLDLNARAEEVREKKIYKTVQFEANEILERFNKNIEEIKKQSELISDLKDDNLEFYKDILRTQIVFLDSAFDFYMHEITKYGMCKIYDGVWKRTEKFNNYTIKMKDLYDVENEGRNTNWFVEIVNRNSSTEVYMSKDSVIDQLKLIGLDWQQIANDDFYEEGDTEKPVDKFKRAIQSLFIRRNIISHQADCIHQTAEKNDISEEEVDTHLENIFKIVGAINTRLIEKDRE